MKYKIKGNDKIYPTLISAFYTAFKTFNQFAFCEALEIFKTSNEYSFNGITIVKVSD